MNGGDLVVQALGRQGVSTLFTLCGGHISPILVAGKRRGLRVVDVRDEAAAVFAADAQARLTGVPGIAVVTAGPGATNAVTAVANAKLAQSPVLVLGGAPPTILQGRGALQDIDHPAVMRSQVKQVFAVRRVRDIEGAIARALDAARAGAPGPVFVECPADLLYDEATVRQWYGTGERPSDQTPGDRVRRWIIRRHLDRVFASGPPSAFPVAPAPDNEGPAPSLPFLSRVAAAMEQAERPVLVLGSQAVRLAHAVTDLAPVIDQLGMPVFASGMARGVLPPGHRLFFRHRRTAALQEADLVLLAGVPFDFRLDYGRQIARRAVIAAVSLERTGLGQNRRPTHAAVCEPLRFLLGLARRAPAAPGRHTSWVEALRAREQEREREIADLATRPTEGINPLALCRAIDRVLADDSILVADGGDFVGTASYIIRPRRPRSWLDPGPFGTLGVGGGFALGAKVARPGAEVWILYGDGAAAFSLAEFDTFVRHNLPVIAVVGNDGSWAQIARGQTELLGDDVGTRLRRTAYHQVAEGYGGVGLELTDPDCMDAVLTQAKSVARDGRPVLVNAMIGSSEFRAGSISL